jgi:signal transduction histidine kinase/DNA-binding response OmpR family regulator
VTLPGYHSRSAVILVVDDELPNLELLAACLAGEGYTNVTCVRDSREVMAAFESIRPDLVLLDLHMPAPNGFEILRLIGQRTDGEEFLPILVLTADVTEQTKERALSGGATDFLTKPLNLSEAILRIGNLLHTRFLHQQQRQALRMSEAAGRRATFLADASHVLASSLDQETALSVLCRTAVPRLADCCVVDLFTEEGAVRRVGAAHIDPTREPLLLEAGAGELHRPWREDPFYGQLQENGKLYRIEDTHLDPALLAGMRLDPAFTTPPTSLIAVPLFASGLTHGVLILAATDASRDLTAEDLDLAREVGRRAGMAIENARLYSHAVEATRARDELLAIVAHDLRSPLSTVTMGSAMLHDAAPSAELRSYADLVGRAAERMNQLVQDLLDAARINNRKLQIQPFPQAPSTVVKEAVALLAPLAHARSIELCSRVGSALPLVAMDTARVQQVLSNLVGNALKFTPSGGRIEIVCEDVGGQVRFAVSDTGPGIDPQHLPHLFGRFWQADDRDVRGIGLGLSIVRGIVEAHGGRVWVESEPGHGATFYFTLGGVEAPLPTQLASA